MSKVLVALRAAFTALLDPTRQAALGETTGNNALMRIRDQMLMDRTGRKILRTRPIITTTTIDLVRLSKLPKASFGYNYYDFLALHNVSPDTRVPVKYIQDEELAYVMTRYRQVHDFWHTLTRLPVTVEAEIGLKAFEYLQTGLPMNALSVIFGPIGLSSEERRVLLQVYIPWALNCSSTSVFLMNVMYEDLFDRPLDEVQALLGLSNAPQI